MQDIQTRLRQLRRPKLLTKAARFGLDEYVRSIHLRRALQSDHLPKPALAVIQLLDIESGLNAERKEKRATYSAARHVEILVALLAEAQTLSAMQIVK